MPPKNKGKNKKAKRTFVKLDDVAAEPAPTPPAEALPGDVEGAVTPAEALKLSNDYLITSSYVPGSDPTLEQKIREGSVVVGRFAVYKRWAGGLVFINNTRFGKNTLVINLPDNKGDALNGDIVAVEIIGEHMMKDELLTDQPALFTGGDADGAEAAAAEGEPASGRMPLSLPDGRPVVRAIRGAGATRKAATAEQQLCEELGAPATYDWGPPTVQKLGRVVRVLRREIHAYQMARIADGVLAPGQAVQPNYYYRFQLYDALMPQVQVQGRNIPAACHDRLRTSLVLLKLQSDEHGRTVIARGDMRAAQFHALVGDAESAASNAIAIASTHGIPPEHFSAEVEACVPETMPIPSADELAATGRRDLRDTEFVCTIDPATARDLDDALSIRRTPGGGYHVGVHIADVSHFVQPDTPLDAEAARRCTSTYFVDHVVPMLPRKLSEDYCSLNPGESKFAFSSLFEIDRDGHVVSEWFGQSVIRSRCRLAYEQAQAIIDGGDADAAVELDVAAEAEITGTAPEKLRAQVRESVKLLHELAAKRRAESMERGRLSIGNARLSFVYDSVEESTVALAPKGFYVSEQIVANWIVEEFMLLANARAAEKIVQFLPDGAMLRMHPAAKPAKIQKLAAALRPHDVHVFGSSAKALQQTLDAARTSPLFGPLCTLMKYSQTAARYFANDVMEEGSRAHFALGLPWYTHFTSPIRRYCDIMAHRQLLAAVELEALMLRDGIELPPRPSAGLVVDPAADPASAIPQCARLYSPEDLVHGRYVYDPSEVADIAERANKRKESARKAGDQSLIVFFCLYLLALRRKAAVDPTIAPVQRTTATIIEMTGGSLRLYAPEIATEVIVGLHDTKQSFRVKPPPPAEDDDADENEDAEGQEKNGKAPASGATEKEIDQKRKAHLTKKGGKANKAPRGQGHPGGNDGNNNDPPTVTLLWGASDKTPTADAAPGSAAAETVAAADGSAEGEGEEEELALFDDVVVELHVVRQSGCLDLFMKLVPPAERKVYYASGVKIPKSLV